MLYYTCKRKQHTKEDRKMKVKELKEMLEELDENMEIEVSADYRKLRPLDVWFEEQKIWVGDYLKSVYIMWGVRD